MPAVSTSEGQRCQDVHCWTDLLLMMEAAQRAGSLVDSSVQPSAQRVRRTVDRLVPPLAHKRGLGPARAEEGVHQGCRIRDRRGEVQEVLMEDTLAVWGCYCT